MTRKIDLAILLLLIFALVGVIPAHVSSTTSNGKMAAKLYAPPGGGKKPPKISVDIRNLGNGDIPDHLRQGATVDVIAQVSGDVNRVTYKIDGGTEVDMTQWGDSDRYYASWSINQAVGSHTVTVTAYSGGGKRPKTYTDTVTVEVVLGYEAELWYEIDYMYDAALGKDFRPLPGVLEYWVAYWDARAILVHPVIDDPVPWQYEIEDPWWYEANYNDNSPHPNDPNWYSSQWKWMLWADYDVDHNVGGSTYVAISGNDALGGNYITIYKGMIDDYYAPYGIEFGGEVTVTMHEGGHSIGVARLACFGPYCFEDYDDDTYSVMSTMNIENAGFTDHWYYSWNYWDTRNLEYY